MINTFLIAVLLTTCARAIEFHYKIIDIELKPYYNEYHHLLDKNCPTKKYNKTNRFIIELVDDMREEHNWLGVCEQKVNGFSIKIDKGYWDTAVDSDRRQLMFHELAHCLIYKDHVDDPNHYMDATFGSLPEDVYMKQAIEDIQEACK